MFNEIYKKYELKDKPKNIPEPKKVVRIPPLLEKRDEILSDLYKKTKTARAADKIQICEFGVAYDDDIDTIEEYEAVLKGLKEKGFLVDFLFKPATDQIFTDEGDVIDMDVIRAECKINAAEFIKALKFLWESKKHLSNKLAKHFYNLIRTIEIYQKNPKKRDEKLNKLYIGEARWGSSYAVVPINPTNKEKYRKLKKSSRRTKPEEEWIASKIPVPIIIDKELFYKARKRLETNFEMSRRNVKNEYLLGQKIYCVCGNRRTGEGALHGKHLYYRCIDRTLRHPLPKVCNEKGVNARTADELVWEKLAKLLTSKKLLKAQATRWLHKKKNKAKLNQGDLGAMLKELEKLKEQEDRYNKAYGAGVFTIEKLKEYTLPIAEKISSLETQIAKYKQDRDRVATLLPEESEIEAFTKETKKVIKTFDFAMKRAAVIKSINKIIGTKTELKVAGCIPIYTQNVAFNSSHRNCGFAKCGQVHII